MAGFRSTIYARMEEMSFRSGAVAALGVLAAASPSARVTAKAKRSVTPQAAYDAPAQRAVTTTPQAPALPAAAYPQPHRVKRPTFAPAGELIPLLAGS